MTIAVDLGQKATKQTNNKLEIVHCTYIGVSGYNLKKNCILLSEDLFTFINSVDPDEMQHYAAFHLGLHCLQKYSLRGFPEYKWLKILDCWL